MPDQLVYNNVYQASSQACITDLTPPTFSGISGLGMGSMGQLLPTWSVATDASTPIRYEVYVQAYTNTGLFSLANIAEIVTGTSASVFQLADGSYLSLDTLYYVGVRAVDGVGNRDSNTVSLSDTSTGVAEGAAIYEPKGAFTINSSDQLQGTIWISKNANNMTTGLGTASYVIYDKTGALVGGMSESGITADANGQYKITPVASTLSNTLDHYLIRVTINADSANRIAYVPLIQKSVVYKCHGVFSISTTNQFQGTLWGSVDDMAASSGLGTASYTVYDSSGTPVVGLTQSGIAADGNGRFIITPVLSPLLDLTHYTIRISITIDGELRTSYRGLTLGI